MVQKLDNLKESPSQTAGPYVHIGLTPNFSGITGVYDADLGTTMLGDAPKGDRITVTGRVLDGTGTPLRDALLEIWHADASGIYPGQDGADADVYGEEETESFMRSFKFLAKREPAVLSL